MCQVCSKRGVALLTWRGGDLVCQRCLLWSIDAEANRGDETMLETQNRRLSRAWPLYKYEWMVVSIAVILALLMWRCGDVPTGADMVVQGAVGEGVAGGGLEDAGVADTSANGVGGVAEGAGACEQVGLERRGIRWLVDGGKQLLLLVPMSPAIGEAYVNVWTPDVNTTLLGRGPANEWFGVSLPGYGSWRIRLAAETIDHTGVVRQCDRHVFTVVALPPPPVPAPEPAEEFCEYDEILERIVCQSTPF